MFGQLGVTLTINDVIDLLFNMRLIYWVLTVTHDQMEAERNILDFLQPWFLLFSSSIFFFHPVECVRFVPISSHCHRLSPWFSSCRSSFQCFYIWDLRLSENPARFPKQSEMNINMKQTLIRRVNKTKTLEWDVSSSQDETESFC